MLDTSIFFLFQNIFLITTLFWLLSFLGTKFFKKKQQKYSAEIFECGFLTTHDLNLTFNYNFFLTATLLILYDLEFFFLLPYVFNFNITTYMATFLFLFFLVFILISFIYDWEMVSLNWSV